MNATIEPTQGLSDFWSVPQEDLFHRLRSTPQGMSAEEVRRTLAGGPMHVDQGLAGDAGSLAPDSAIQEPDHPDPPHRRRPVALPGGDAPTPLIILAIVLASGLLGFWQEWGAADALERLLALVQTRASVLRDGRPVDVPSEQVVPGDVVLLRAGDIIPGDGRVLDETDLFVAEATLTGETFPVEKSAGAVPPDAPLGRRTNCLFLGTSVVSGTARLLVVRTGRDTEFGRISGSLRLRPPETGFERGIRRFGYLLLEVTLLLVLAIFAINVALHRPVLESFLFSVAIAVGLTPQLLPAIISVNLAHGASRMARERVIVRRLASIENLGGMDVLCSDKTGTLTEGKVRLHAVVDATGRPSERTGLYAYLNASLQSGYCQPDRRGHRRRGTPGGDRLSQARRGALRFRPQAAQRAGRRGREEPARDQGGPGERAGGLHVRRGGGRATWWIWTRCDRRSSGSSPSSAARACARWGSPIGTWAPRPGFTRVTSRG